MIVFKMKNIPDGINMLTLIDGSKCKLEEVRGVDCENGTLFQYLAQSNQSNYIQIVHLIDIEIGTPSILKNMMVLTTLELTYTNKMVDISLTDHLNGRPLSIRRLSIACTRLLVDAPNTQVSSIQVLEIKCSKFIRGLDKVITSCFPDLKLLKMTGEIPYRMNIIFGNSSFQCACFHPTNLGQFNFIFYPPKKNKYIHHHFKSKYRKLNKKDIHNLPTLNVASLIQEKLTVGKETRIDSLSHC